MRTGLLLIRGIDVNPTTNLSATPYLRCASRFRNAIQLATDEMTHTSPDNQEKLLMRAARRFFAKLHYDDPGGYVHEKTRCPNGGSHPCRMPRRLLERIERRGATSTSAAPQAASSSQGAVAAGGNDEPSPAATASGSPEEIIAQIQQDFANTEQSLLDQQTSLANQIGDSFDGYVANEAAVQAWYDLAVSETEAHGARTIENARQYYRSVVDNIDHGETGLSTMRSTTSTI